MRRMFGAVSLLCVAVGIVAMVLRVLDRNEVFSIGQYVAAMIGFGATVGAAIGLPFGKSFIGATTGVVLAALFMAYWAI